MTSLQEQHPSWESNSLGGYLMARLLYRKDLFHDVSASPKDGHLTMREELS